VHGRKYLVTNESSKACAFSQLIVVRRGAWSRWKKRHISRRLRKFPCLSD